MKKRREAKRGYSTIISKCTVKWSIIRAVQAKPGFLKTWVEFQIRGKTWVPGTVFWKSADFLVTRFCVIGDVTVSGLGELVDCCVLVCAEQRKKPRDKSGNR